MPKGNPSFLSQLFDAVAAFTDQMQGGVLNAAEQEDTRVGRGNVK